MKLEYASIHSFALENHIERSNTSIISERTILAVLVRPGDEISVEERFEELQALVETAGGIVVGNIIQKRGKPRASTFFGKGKIQELASACEMLDASLVVFDHDLTPAQIREIEKIVSRKVLDRSEMILDIFASRAVTYAAKLQVEIAQLEYTYPRLRAMWDHLGQVTGGAPIGIGTRGPGETQIEIDRRLVQRRLQVLRAELKKIKKRKEREVVSRNQGGFTIGLVGYTNAGKSTLFNKLTSGGAFAHEQLFATLGTRIERWTMPNGSYGLLSDTVGFC